jgi:hypothetical protein
VAGVIQVDKGNVAQGSTRPISNTIPPPPRELIRLTAVSSFGQVFSGLRETVTGLEGVSIF